MQSFQINYANWNPLCIIVCLIQKTWFQIAWVCSNIIRFTMANQAITTKSQDAGCISFPTLDGWLGLLWAVPRATFTTLASINAPTWFQMDGCTSTVAIGTRTKRWLSDALLKIYIKFLVLEVSFSWQKNTCLKFFNFATLNYSWLLLSQKSFHVLYKMS